MTARRGGLVLGIVCGLAVSLIFISGFVAGAAFDRHQVNQTVDMSDPNIQSFLSAYRLVTQRSYYRPFNKQKLLYAAIDGMLSATGDPHTVFLSPSENRQASTQLNGAGYSGIGAMVQPVSGSVEIVAPMAGSPAARARLKSGDLIIAVNGSSLRGLPGDSAIARILGRAGTVVRLTIQRGHGRPFVVALRRAQIAPVTAYARTLPHRLGLVQILSFGDNTVAQTTAALRSLAAQHVRGIVLDLRENPGGFVDSAQRIASLFLSHGVVAYEQLSNQQLMPLDVLRGQQIARVPVAILVDSGTASAAEILAAALRDDARAVLVGTRTYGKGSMQSVYQLANGSTMRLTDRLWLTPKKRSVNHVGLTPDIAVSPAATAPGGLDDPDVLAAEKYLLSHPGP